MHVMGSVLVKCKKCRRPFAITADRCPDCGKRSRRGTRGLIAKIVSIVIAAMALAATASLVIGQFRLREVRGDSSAAREPLPPAQGSTDGQIGFASE